MLLIAHTVGFHVTDSYCEVSCYWQLILRGFMLLTAYGVRFHVTDSLYYELSCYLYCYVSCY